jgi:hypothetical protein
MNPSTHHRRSASAAWLAALTIAGCGGEAALLIPLFEFGFEGQSGATKIELFFLDTPTTETGTFVNGVNMNVGLVQQHYSGSWARCSFALTIDAGTTPEPPTAAKYAGRFTGPSTIVLSPAVGSDPITLTRKPGALSRNSDC